MASNQCVTCPLVESSGKAPRARPRNLLKSTIRNAGMSIACITNPSSADSQALLHAAMQLGAEIARQKPATQRIPAFTKAVSCSEISALPPTECSICLCNIDDSDASCGASPSPAAAAALKLGCGHLFHPACIALWLKRDASCPTCRWQCRQMRHARVKAAARVVDDEWEEEALKAGDRVWVLNGSGDRRKAGKVVCLEQEDQLCHVCVQFNDGACGYFPVDDVHYMSEEACEAAAAQLGRFATSVAGAM